MMPLPPRLIRMDWRAASESSFSSVPLPIASPRSCSVFKHDGSLIVRHFFFTSTSISLPLLPSIRPQFAPASLDLSSIGAADGLRTGTPGQIEARLRTD